MSDKLIQDVALAFIKKTDAPDPDPNELTLEECIKLVTYSRADYLSEKEKNELSQLLDRIKKIEELNKILSAINSATNESGELDISNNEELKNQLERAKELGCDITEGKEKFNSNERERLVKNISSVKENFDNENRRQEMVISRLQKDIYLTYEMAITSSKRLNDAKSTIARNIQK